MAILFILIAFFAAFLGGLMGIKYRDRLHLVLGFTAGVLISVVSLDIFPEIIGLVKSTGAEPIFPMVSFVTGFFLFHVIEKLFIVHTHDADMDTDMKEEHHPAVGTLSALALTVHTFLDGLAIGLSFQVNPSLGIAVGLGIIAHSFSDGLNTVSLMLMHGNSLKQTLRLLILNAAAPLLGGLVSVFVTLSEKTLLLSVGFIGGFLLYIGASDILPEAHSKNSSYKTILATILGVLFIYAISHL